MLDSKFLITLVGLIITVVAISNTSFTPTINEGFGGIPSRTVRVEREVYASEADVNCGNGRGIPFDYHNMDGSLKFIQRPSFQASLSPRFSNQNYGANIKYNMPSYENQGVPYDSMSLGNMAKEGYNSRNIKENYGSGSTVTQCGKGGANLNSNNDIYNSNNISENTSYVKAVNKAYNDTYDSVPTDMLPEGDMSQTIGADGSVVNNFIYDRYIYANQKSYLRSQGDPIRGDLPIVPCKKSGWFNVSVTPHIDLQAGAINVMAGTDNASNRDLMALMALSSGNSGKGLIQGGVDMTQDYTMTGSGGMGRDVSVRSFL